MPLIAVLLPGDPQIVYASHRSPGTIVGRVGDGGGRAKEEHASMWMTVVEGHVAAERWAEFVEIFAREPRPAALRETFQVQSASDPTLWRLIGVWASREELQAYVQSVPVPGAPAMFRAVGAEPVLSQFDVKGHGGL
jgi:quinol monooxygenase YgiN